MIKKIKAFLFKLKLKRKGISMADFRLMVLNQRLLERLAQERKEDFDVCTLYQNS